MQTRFRPRRSCEGTWPLACLQVHSTFLEQQQDAAQQRHFSGHPARVELLGAPLCKM